MKEFLNKLKTPTKILSIVCFVLVIMLFKNCSSANEFRYKNSQLTEQLDSILVLKDSIEGQYKETTIVKNTSELTNDSKDLLIKELRDKNLIYEGIISDLRQSISDYKNTITILRRDKCLVDAENTKLRKKLLEYEQPHIQ